MLQRRKVHERINAMPSLGGSSWWSPIVSKSIWTAHDLVVRMAFSGSSTVCLYEIIEMDAFIKETTLLFHTVLATTISPRERTRHEQSEHKKGFFSIF